MQDIENGCGVGVLAPEAELLTDEILPYIPPERMDDVVYVNPADIEFPIPINPLHLEEGADIDQSVDDLITIFTRLSNDITPRMREILYHAFYGLLERKGSETRLFRQQTTPAPPGFLQMYFQRFRGTPAYQSIRVSASS